MIRPVSAALLALGLVIAQASSALACACCSSTAQRKVEVVKIDDTIAAELAKLRFAGAAKLKLGEGYEEGIKGLEDAEEDFKVAVTRGKDRITFSLRDEKGRAGTLSLVQPRTISIFEVDTRDSEDKGAGPVLYKEWKITTGVAGDGIFRASVNPKRRITLVLHGRGVSCTTAEEFKFWTLLVHGGGMEDFTFYGDLAPAQ